MEKINLLLNTFKTLNLPLNDYVIFGSGPLAIRSIKEPKDLDILVRKGIYEKIKSENESWRETEISPGKFYMENDEEYPSIELYDAWGPGNWDFDELFSRSEIIDDLRFASVPDVLEYKKRNWEDKKREKDFSDMELIEKFLDLKN